MLRSLVITRTASALSGTGEPIPMSSPVSRGKSFLTGDNPFSDVGARWAGASGACLAKLGTLESPPQPTFAPFYILVE